MSLCGKYGHVAIANAVIARPRDEPSYMLVNWHILSSLPTWSKWGKYHAGALAEVAPYHARLSGGVAGEVGSPIYIQPNLPGCALEDISA